MATSCAAGAQTRAWIVSGPTISTPIGNRRAGVRRACFSPVESVVNDMCPHAVQEQCPREPQQGAGRLEAGNWRLGTRDLGAVAFRSPAPSLQPLSPIVFHEQLAGCLIRARVFTRALFVRAGIEEGGQENHDDQA